jgi:hypothetical protein
MGQVNRDMTTEWLKIMLEEIERRRQEARRAREEEDKRRQEQAMAVPRAQSAKR